jgi:hypothetical protein
MKSDSTTATVTSLNAHRARKLAAQDAETRGQALHAELRAEAAEWVAAGMPPAF